MWQVLHSRWIVCLEWGRSGPSRETWGEGGGGGRELSHDHCLFFFLRNIEFHIVQMA